MKNQNKLFIILSVIVLLLVVKTSYSQKYIDEIATGACDCFSRISDTLNADALAMQMGLCIYEAAGPYQKKLLKNHDIDLNDVDGAGEKLGVFVATQMMSECPEMLTFYSDLITDPEFEDLEEYYAEDEYFDLFEAKGVVTSVSSDCFIEISLKEESGRIYKYHWLSYIDSDFDIITEYQNLVGDMIIIKYDFVELFDPRINEYRDYRLIYEIELNNKIE